MDTTQIIKRHKEASKNPSKTAANIAIAKQIGVTPETVYNIQKDANRVKHGTVVKYLNAIGYEVKVVKK